MSILNLFSSNPTITLTWNDEESLPTVRVPQDDDRQVDKLVLFSSEQPVGGRVDVAMPANTKKIEHMGIKAELVGQIELHYDRGNHYIFFSSQKELAGPGILTQDMSYKFLFSDKDNDKKYESYDGINVRLRYFVRVRINRPYSAITKDFDFAVQKIQPEPDVNNELKMEVGIEDCLHIEFEYDQSKYHLKDVIRGKIFFLLVRIKIKHMELQILKREATGSGPNLYNETQPITKFEIMDGAPIKGETVPIRFFLEPYEVTPTFRTIHNKFSVKYYLNLVLVDEEERRYFKQQEITLWRKELKHHYDPFAKPLSG
eukprot:CAMPEP_0202688286 /NCGR_PEP_ID=MMETSP1385-20130828/3811_1 /ASSEMBLY_ACC=CAM_ASM_000861 /TAXON_ID=933848 /ORGANISM="Elphidium margaritaceum" /LENGTH=314 /DNA_ID=CAMNT_0049343221 /DNA_START=1569 /DNA_END=2513 /DNA_ORIENTATION=-